MSRPYILGIDPRHCVGYSKDSELCHSIICYSWFHTSFIWRCALTFSRHCDNNRPGCVWDIFTFPAGSSMNRIRRILDGVSWICLRLHLRILPFPVLTIYGRGSTHLDFTIGPFIGTDASSLFEWVVQRSGWCVMCGSIMTQFLAFV